MEGCHRYDVSNDKQLQAPGKWTHNAIAEFPAETKDTSSETRTVFATDKEFKLPWLLDQQNQPLTWTILVTRQ